MRTLGAVTAFVMAVTGSTFVATAASADDGEGAAGAEVRVSGVLHEGTPGQVVYEAIKPAEWNGTLILDLDFNGWPAVRRDYFLDAGYAIGGNQRTQNETAYEITQYVDNLLTTRQILSDAVAATGQEATPTRTIAWGNSRGGFVARMAAQYKPEIFDGAIGSAGGGAGVVASWLGKADAVWALQQLVNPDAGLTINNLPDIPEGASYGPNYDQDVKLNALVTEARSSDAGLARVVLAGAFEQATDFPSGNEPPAADDYHTQGLNIASGFAFGNPQFVHKEIEVMAGGPVVWNHGIDYRDLLNRSGDRERVEWWYDHAGLDLEADLDALNAAPRYSADPAALAVVEQIGTYTGTGSPVITIKTVGDSADPAPLDEAYVRTFEASGNGDELLRALLINRSRHGGQTFGEHLAAFQVLEERLDTGTWPDVSPEAMNARVADLPAQTGLAPEVLGAEGRYIPFDIPPALRTWDFTNWGTYSPQADSGIPVSVSVVDAPGSLALTVAEFGSGVGLVPTGNIGDRLRFAGELPKVTVTDSRNAAQAAGGGWATSGQSSAFSSTVGSFTAAHFGWDPRVLDARDGVTPGSRSVTALDGGAGLSTPSSLAAATDDGRRGSTSMGAGLFLDIPVDTTEGTYTATVTVSLFPTD